MESVRQEMTDVQIENAAAVYRTVLREHRAELGCGVMQHILAHPAYAAEQVAVLRKRIEAIRNLIVCRVSVNGDCTPEEALKATDRQLFAIDEVLKNMPRSESGEEEVFLFKLDYDASDDELDKEYALRVLVPAPPYALARLNRVRYSFSDENPNITHWRDKDGRWCYLSFRKLLVGGRCAYVGRHTEKWHPRWYHAGVRTMASRV